MKKTSMKEGEQKRHKTDPTIIKDMDTAFVQSIADYEKYVLLNTRSAGYDIDGFMRISNGRKSIYRKARGRNGVCTNEVALAYRSQAELGVKSESEVFIRPASFLAYYWYNSEKHTKWVFRIAVIGFVLTILSAIISIISLFVRLPLLYPYSS